MPLILAIEPDRRQAAQLTAVIRQQVGAELVLADTTEGALVAIGRRVPDLVLAPALLAPQDDAALASALRVIAAASHVRTLTIPVFDTGVKRQKPARGGMLARLGFARGADLAPAGCDPTVFAEQIATYLDEAARERDAAAAFEEADLLEPASIAEPAVETAFAREPAPAAGGPAIDEPQAVEEPCSVDEPFAVEAFAPGSTAAIEEPPAQEAPTAVEPYSVGEPLAVEAFAPGPTAPIEEPPVQEAPPAEEPQEVGEPSRMTERTPEPSRIDNGLTPAIASPPFADAPAEDVRAESIPAIVDDGVAAGRAVCSSDAAAIAAEAEIARDQPAAEHDVPRAAVDDRQLVDISARPPFQPEADADVEEEDDSIDLTDELLLLCEEGDGGQADRPDDDVPVYCIDESPDVLLGADPEIVRAPGAAARIAWPAPAAARPIEPAQALDVTAELEAIIDERMEPAGALAPELVAVDAPTEAVRLPEPIGEALAVPPEEPAATEPAPAERLAAEPELRLVAEREEQAIVELQAALAEPLPFDERRTAPHVNWPTLRLGPRWPRLNTAPAAAFRAAPLPESPEEEMPAAPPTPSPGEPASPPRAADVRKAFESEWVELVESLRLDIERLKAGARAPAAGAAARAEPPPAPGPKRRVPKKKPPVQDEWGFFDPEQCGFAALLAKLDEITEGGDEPAARPH
ncbi:MAG: hypothetical protein IT176_05510 [Acidobacteria bacterium]|nr:hypothetical protein [Acidobacteriota bacterium]